MAKAKPLPRGVSAEDFAELDRMAKRANQRLASAKEGQREALQHYVEGKFSRAKPGSRAEYNQRMRELERFLSSKQTTISGWNEIKQLAVENANKTLTKSRHYDLTDQELGNILKELDKKSQKQFYKVLDLVQAKKYDAAAKGKKMTEKQLQEAVNKAVLSHASAGEAILRKERARARFERSAESLR